MPSKKYQVVELSDSEYESFDSDTEISSSPSSPGSFDKSANMTIGERQLAETLAELSLEGGLSKLGRNYRMGGSPISAPLPPYHSPTKKGGSRNQSVLTTPSPRKVIQTPSTPIRQPPKITGHTSSPVRTPKTTRAQRQNSKVVGEAVCNSRSQPITVQETPSPRPSPQSSQLSSQTSIASDVIRSNMSVSEIIHIMQRHNCTDLTDQLGVDSFESSAESWGGFGDIYRGKLRSGDPVAVKSVRNYVNGSHGRKHLKSTAREMHTWSKLKHPNVVSVLGLAEFRGRVAMISPWIANGNLVKYLSENPQVDKWKLCKGITGGLAYLHALKVVHGDLKGDNVLISADEVPMLTDFGGSNLQEGSIEFSGSTSGGHFSSRWAAPEVLTADAKYTKDYAADVYSLGMTILQTMTRKIPYHWESSAKAMFSIINAKLPERPDEAIPHRSDDGDALWFMLEQCWAFEPEDRPGVHEVIDMMGGITWEGLQEWKTTSDDEAT